MSHLLTLISSGGVVRASHRRRSMLFADRRKTAAVAVVALAASLAGATALANPVAEDDSDMTNYMEPIDLDVLLNDDPGPNQLDPSSINASTPTGGTIDVDPVSGVISYTPSYGFYGLDSFEYTVEDDYGNVSNTALVFVDVNDPVPPAAGDDVDYTLYRQSIIIDVLSNDFGYDAPLDPSTLVIELAPMDGVAIVVDGKIDYTPNAGFSGFDGFVYSVKDENGTVSNSAFVDIFVDVTRPDAFADNASTAFQQSVVIGVLDNDVWYDEPLDPQSIVITQSPMNGDVSVKPDGTVTYTPAIGFAGDDDFEYTVSDLNGTEANVPAPVSISVGISAPPTVSLIAVKVDENLWNLSGIVSDDQPVAGLVIDFGGIVIGSAVVDADGNYSKVVSVTPGDQGLVTASTTDSHSNASNEPWQYVDNTN